MCFCQAEKKICAPLIRGVFAALLGKAGVVGASFGGEKSDMFFGPPLASGMLRNGATVGGGNPGEAGGKVAVLGARLCHTAPVCFELVMALALISFLGNLISQECPIGDAAICPHAHYFRMLHFFYKLSAW